MIEHVVFRCQLLSVFAECRPCSSDSFLDFRRFPLHMRSPKTTTTTFIACSCGCPAGDRHHLNVSHLLSSLCFSCCSFLLPLFVLPCVFFRVCLLFPSLVFSCCLMCLSFLILFSICRSETGLTTVTYRHMRNCGTRTERTLLHRELKT